MKHRIYGKHLGRDKNQRTALFRGLVRALLLHQSITTTESKAKAIKGLVDKLITKGKENNEAAKRVVVSTLAQPEISKKLIEEIAPKYKNRTSGFTSIVKLGRRAGDGAMLVKMSLVSPDNQLSVLSGQLSDIRPEGLSPKDRGQSVVSSSVTGKLKTEKHDSENRKQKTDNRKTRKKESK